MMYVTVPASPRTHQMSLDEFLYGADDARNYVVTANRTNTRTYETNVFPDIFRYFPDFNIRVIEQHLKEFNEQTKDLRAVEDRHALYRKFFIPKKSGGLREINAPEPALMEALRKLKAILENDCHAMYHTSAFAYVHGRSTIDAIKRHQSNESKWYAKFDLHDFFGSTTKEFVMSQFKQIFPFASFPESTMNELSTALDLCFLDGGLPQGTPISPTITNIMMIPVDFILNNGFRDFKYVGNDGAQKEFHCVYTRYADDFLVSCKYDFDYKKAEEFIINTITKFGPKFYLNSKKTRYGSRSGSNWNLGVMVNKDNEITIGYRKKRQFNAMLFSYAMDKKNGNPWPIDDVRHLDGIRSYYAMVEKDNINSIVEKVSTKTGVDIMKEIHKDLNPNN